MAANKQKRDLKESKTQGNENREKELARIYRVSKINIQVSKHRLAGSYVVVLLVWLVGSFRVSNLSLQVVVVLGFKVFNSFPVTPLSVSVNIHLDYTVTNGLLDIGDIRTTSSVENKVNRLLVLRGLVTKLVGNILLCLVQNLRVKFNISRTVYPMHISEGSSDYFFGTAERPQRQSLEKKM